MSDQTYTYLTPGPSKAYPKLDQFMQDAIEQQIVSISHRGPQFSEIYDGSISLMRSLLGIPNDYYIFYFSSATEIWERIAQNCIESTSFHCNNGIFGYRFVWAVQMMKKQAINHEVPYGHGFDLENLEVPEEAELISFTHNESSTGVMLDIDKIAACKDRYPQKLIAVDVVSSVPYPQIPFEKLDMTYFSVQKGFGLPAGLGVCIMSPQAFQRSAFLQRNGHSIGTYHNFQYLNKYHLRAQTPETPNVLGIYLFHRVLQDMHETDLSLLRAEIDDRAGYLYDYFDHHDKYHPFVERTDDRSPTMIVVRTYGDSSEIIAHLKKNGLIVGAGYGDLKEQHIRIANFPSHTMDEMKRLTASLDRFRS